MVQSFFRQWPTEKIKLNWGACKFWGGRLEILTTASEKDSVKDRVAA